MLHIQTPTKGVTTLDHRFYLLKFQRNGWTRPKCFFHNCLYCLLTSVFILILICSALWTLDCDDPMGMGNGQIPNSALKAASVVWLIQLQKYIFKRVWLWSDLELMFHTEFNLAVLVLFWAPVISSCIKALGS